MCAVVVDMGSNVWQFEKDWPIPNTVYTRWELRDGMTLQQEDKEADQTESSAATASSSSSRFDYDAEDPAPTLGGNNCCGAPTIAGPKDQSPLEARRDVLSFTSAPLLEPLAIAGPLTASLRVATTSTGPMVRVRLFRLAVCLVAAAAATDVFTHLARLFSVLRSGLDGQTD